MVRAITWLSADTILENEIKRLTGKLKQAKRKKDVKTVKRLEQKIKKLNKTLNDLE